MFWNWSFSGFEGPLNILASHISDRLPRPASGKPELQFGRCPQRPERRNVGTARQRSSTYPFVKVSLFLASRVSKKCASFKNLGRSGCEIFARVSKSRLYWNRRAPKQTYPCKAFTLRSAYVRCLASGKARCFTSRQRPVPNRSTAVTRASTSPTVNRRRARR